MGSAISDKTRKALWGKAAAKCSLCRTSLIVSGSEGILITVGEECHIVGQGQFGPRRIENFSCDELHEYTNLLLLFRNCHKRIDANTAKYTTEVLQEIKIKHEEWVSKKLIQTARPSGYSTPFPLACIETGRAVINLVAGAEAFCCEIDDSENYEAMMVVAGLMQSIKDYGDIWSEISETSRMEARFEFSKVIEEIRNGGLTLYGTQRRKVYSDGVDSFNLEVAYFMVYNSNKWINGEAGGVEPLETLLVCEPLGVSLA